MININGIIIINKEKGYTSHDVVNVVRKILNTKKVGHTGTLDPEATGVLPICIGKGTKVSDMLMISDKEYVAGVRLGVVTDTEDIFGMVKETNEVNVSEDDIREACMSFLGEIEQTPPMYSAIKINGKKLYEYARAGVEVERKKRKVTIHGIEVYDIEKDFFKIRVACSKGTYIRTLCADIGKRLGCGACMESLVRTKSSVFTIDNAITLDTLRKKVDSGCADDVLVPVDKVFYDYGALSVSGAKKKKLLNGATYATAREAGKYRIYDENGVFLCIAEVKKRNDINTVKMVKCFISGDVNE